VEDSERKTPGDTTPEPSTEEWVGGSPPRLLAPGGASQVGGSQPASAASAPGASDPAPPAAVAEPSSPVPETASAATASPDGQTPSHPAGETPSETPKTSATSPSPPDTVADKQPARKKRPFFPHLRFLLAVAGGTAALIGAALASLGVGGGARAPQPVATAAALAMTMSAEEPAADVAGADAAADVQVDGAPAKAAVWRVAQLADDPNVSLVEVVIDRRPLLAALAGAHVAHSEATRIVTSLGEVRDVDRFGLKDTLTLALDKTAKRVVAYELAESPSDVWQAREEAQADGTQLLEAKKLRLEVERVRIGKAAVVGADLRASFVDAGLAPIDDILSLLDDALEGHAELSDIRPGARLRLIATQERIDGNFVRWASLEAVEYFPASPNAPSVRVYFFAPGDDRDDQNDRDDSDPASGHKKRNGWYDAKGRQPVHGGWRSPVPLARIASRFNPHRMHPVLHVVMPHNGVDFAAPIGAPVYATAAGTVTGAGNAGPCGNRVEISHAGGVTSIYCHLSRFAQGLHVGEHVEQRQLIAYVGQTGRVTGPHLHFGIRKGGVYVDPMTFRLDGARVVPRNLRDEFDRHRAALDADLDGIPLPAPSAVGTEAPPAEPETFYEEP
jgi:murein DD-endopeptidase MepM/ murein hydrolase activator NlpD